MSQSFRQRELSFEGPLLALSRHELVRCTCPLSGVKQTSMANAGRWPVTLGAGPDCSFEAVPASLTFVRAGALQALSAADGQTQEIIKRVSITNQAFGKVF
jgi:hypothetical protein